MQLLRFLWARRPRALPNPRRHVQQRARLFQQAWLNINVLLCCGRNVLVRRGDSTPRTRKSADFRNGEFDTFRDSFEPFDKRFFCLEGAISRLRDCVYPEAMSSPWAATF
jgi:hypothetical protein